jgi:hypothetical protein
MVSVTIYVEGGGDCDELKTRCRKGFSKLIKKMGFDKRMPRIVACGGRDKAYEKFNTAITSASNDEFPILLVDSEDPITSGPWEHLKARDCRWDRPVGAKDDQAQMMATCMETWIMADHEALREVFGSCLREGTLFPLNDLENRLRKELYETLVSATNDCGKNKGYEKGARSFQILEILNPKLLEDNLPYFKRFRETLDQHLKQIEGKNTR